MFRQLAPSVRREKRMLGVIALLSGTEVLALVTLAPLVQAAADGETRYSGSPGPD